MPRAAEMTCDICGYRTLYDADQPKSKPKTCRRCGRDYGSGTFTPIQDPDASPSTHNMVRWGCRECGHYGVSWIPKSDKYLPNCPNCGVAYNPSVLRCQRFDPTGSCKTIWKPVEGLTRSPIVTNLPKKRYSCPNCGYIQRYLVRPKPCPRCGNAAEVEEAHA